MLYDDIFVVDCHNHANYMGNNFKSTIENMNKYNIDRAWLMPCEIPMGEWDPSNTNEVVGFTEKSKNVFENTLEFVDKCPERFVLGYCPDPRDPFAIDKLDAVYHTYGIKYCGEWKFRSMLDNWDNVDLFRYCGDHGLPVVIHLDYPILTGRKYPRPHYWYGGNIEAFERAMELCPNTVFIGHAPGFWANISGDFSFSADGSYPKGRVVGGGKVPELLRKYPNLYCDLSGNSGTNALTRDVEFAKDFVEEFQDRLLYARDMYHSNQLQEAITALDLPKSILRKIYGENSLKLIGAGV